MKQSIFIILFLPLLATAANKYYVSTSGTGSGNGLSTAAPWTLAQFNASFAWGAGDSIFFKRGDVFAGRVNYTRSGAAGNPVYVGPYGTGADPIFTGYSTLTTWVNYGGNVWGAPISGAKAYLHNVAVNGQLFHQARYPNAGYITFTPGSTTSFTTSESSPPNHIGDSIIVKSARFCLDHAKITAQTGSLYTIAGLTYSLSEATGFFYFGDVNFLDAAGEYALNGAGDSLRIYSTVNPATLTVQASTTDTLMYVTGSYIKLDHLAVQGANMANVLNPFGSGNLTITNFSNTMGWFGYDIRSQRDTIIGGTLTDILSNGVWGPTNNVSKYFYISGVKIQRVGLIAGMGRSGNGSYEGINLPADGFYAYKNDIDSTGYNGIFSKFDSFYIVGNKVSHSCIVLADGAGIYTHEPNDTTYPHQRHIDSNQVSYGIGNTEGIIIDPGTMGQGIYLDARTRSCTISNNTVFGCSGAGVFCHGPTNNILNNKLYDNGLVQILLGEYTGGPTITNIVMKGNQLVCPDTSKALVSLYSPSNPVNNFFSVADSNYYATKNAVAPFKTQGGGAIITRTLAQFQSFTGQEAHSTYQTGTWNIVTNPLFTNKSFYQVGKYANPASTVFNYLIPLAPCGSEIVQTLDKGFITVPAGAKLKPH